MIDNTHRNLFDVIAQRVGEAQCNEKAKPVRICLNKAGIMALCNDPQIYQQSIGPHNILQKTLFGLPIVLIDDKPNDKFPDHWRFVLEYKSNE